MARGQSAGDARREPLFMTAKELAGMTGLSVRTIGRMCAERTIPAVKLRNSWRINRAEVMRMLGLA